MGPGEYVAHQLEVRDAEVRTLKRRIAALTKQVTVLSDAMALIANTVHWHYVVSSSQNRYYWTGSEHREVRDFAKEIAARSAAPGKEREDGTR